MGKLKDLVQDESLAERMMDRANRVRLAGLGLIKRVERETNKLFDELVEAGQGDAADNLLNKIDAARRGAVTRVLDESKKLFDELVELGEEATKGPVTRASAPVYEAPAPVKPAAESKPAAVASESAPVADAAPAEEAEDPELDAAFKSAKVRVKSLRSAPDASTLANLYALYKQATEGDVDGKRPGLTEPVERAKFDARKKLKGIGFADAKKQYIALVDSLVGAPA